MLCIQCFIIQTGRCEDPEGPDTVTLRIREAEKYGVDKSDGILLKHESQGCERCPLNGQGGLTHC